MPSVHKSQQACKPERSIPESVLHLGADLLWLISPQQTPFCMLHRGPQPPRSGLLIVCPIFCSILFSSSGRQGYLWIFHNGFFPHQVSLPGTPGPALGSTFSPGLSSSQLHRAPAHCSPSLNAERPSRRLMLDWWHTHSPDTTLHM